MQLPDSIGCLTRLNYLDMLRCKRLRNTPRSIYNLSSLESLCLCDRSDGDNLYGIESLSLLKTLSLANEYCNSLPSNLSQLVNLEDLTVYNCWSLQSLPELPPNIDDLSLRGCTSLDKLPNLTRMNKLIRLDFTKCVSLQSLPNLPPNLRSIYFDDCWSLQFLPELPLSLQTLFLKNCASLRSLPKFPPNLEDLVLFNCTSLRSLQALPSHLYSLHARGCKSLQKLPDLSKLKYLSTLILTNCSNLISNFISSFLQDSSGLGGCNVYLPSRVIQDRFCHHKRTGSSISFQMPGDVKNNFLRMALWVVFEGKHYYSPIEAVITNETDGTQFEYRDYIPTTGVHVWVRSIGKPISMKSGDRIEVSFRGNVTVEMCGVHLDCKRVRDVDVEELLCRLKRLKLSA